ncbi:MAG: amylosucrase, partial [Oscillospiraceae bacterium]|nr:amylosucrase [Oscillospiraceae bacterium]
FTGIGALEALHASHRAFHGAADTWIVETGTDRVLGIGRYYRGEKLIGLFHFGRQPETVWTDQGELFTDLLTGKLCSAQGLTLQPGEFRWLAYDFDAGGLRGS